MKDSSTQGYNGKGTGNIFSLNCGITAILLQNLNVPTHLFCLGFEEKFCIFILLSPTFIITELYEHKSVNLYCLIWTAPASFSLTKISSRFPINKFATGMQ